MIAPELADRYWAQFLATLPAEAARPSGYYEAFSFGSSPASAREIAQLVLAGTKTATGSLLWVYQAEGRRHPQEGDYSIVTDGAHPIGVIVDTEVSIVPYDEVDAAFAWDGGEEDRSLASWRRIYSEYISSECARIGREASGKTPLVCERFRLVYNEPLHAV